ncbi:MAG: TonB-dependent receptor plug domain-containing protein [Fibrobacterota bacterium]
MVTMLRKTTVLFFLFVFTAFSSMEEKQGLDLSNLLQITLKTGSFLELDLKNSPVSINVIDRSDITITNTSRLGEILEVYVPGFQIMENKWVGEIWGMRGVASDINNKFILMINGNKMNAQSRDGTISEMYSYIGEDVNRIEVLRGPAGLVYGSGQLQGS